MSGPGRTPDISLGQARALIERAIDKAEQLGLRGSVAVVGASGVLVSASRMDTSGAGGMVTALINGLEQSWASRPGAGSAAMRP